jgi:hypothetical protein
MLLERLDKLSIKEFSPLDSPQELSLSDGIELRVGREENVLEPKFEKV